MPNYTTNLNLVKPLVTENYDIAKVTNDNADILDSEIQAVKDDILDKQDTLVSGTNIKTINSTSLLGSGDVTVQPTLVSGTNIKTINGNSVLGSGNIVTPTGATYTVYTATIPSSSWTGSSAPFSKVIAVSGILALDEPITDLVLSGTYATDVTMRENWSKIYRIVTTDGNITCYADSIPSADINIQLVVVR